ncbi:MAG: type I-E CRISPR-associated endoribonuclease Cas2 [Clostridia bacterium]|nr:type I-E CRISPR-associated endoribonuclease Cas2 [Clostridia bacterium]
MVVFVLENATEKLRGTLTRWMIETKPGVFVGSLNALVRDKLWEMIPDHAPKGALMIYSCNNEQGFSIKMYGIPTRSVADLDGLQLIKIQQ